MYHSQSKLVTMDEFNQELIQSKGKTYSLCANHFRLINRAFCKTSVLGEFN